MSEFRREASGHSGNSGVRAPFWPRKHRRVVRNRNSGSLGTPSAFGRSACACSRWGLRKCLQGCSEAPRALESASGNAFSVASEPQMQSKVLLGPAPELPHALKCCSGLLRSRLCTRNGCLGKPQSCQVARKACPRQLRNRIAFKQLCGSS